jgi:hypothetical protein
VLGDPALGTGERRSRGGYGHRMEP